MSLDPITYEPRSAPLRRGTKSRVHNSGTTQAERMREYRARNKPRKPPKPKPTPRLIDILDQDLRKLNALIKRTKIK